MSVPQISVFMESRPGHLHRVLDAFEDAHVNVRGFSASDTGDYGVVRFIVDEPDKAIDVLRGMGSATVKSEVLCLRLPDRPGELARVMGILSDRGLNVAHAEEILKDEPVELAGLEEIAASVAAGE